MISLSVSQADLKNFESIVNRMAEATRKESRVVVRNALRDLTYAAVRLTPIAPKLESIESSKVKSSKKYNGEYWIILRHRHTGKLIRLPGSYEDAVRYSYRGKGRKVPNRGFAKACWLANLARLGVEVRQRFPGQSKSSAPEHSDAGIGGAPDDIYGWVSNMAPFIEDLDKGRWRGHTPVNVLNRAIKEVSAKWDRKLDQIGRKLKQKAGAV